MACWRAGNRRRRVSDCSDRKSTASLRSWGGGAIAGAAILALLPCSAHADTYAPYTDPWTVTLYAGPSTNSFFSHIFYGHFQVNGAMAGLAVDARLFHLGGGFSLMSEAQITQYAFGPDYTTGALGIGFRYDFLAFRRYAMSLSLYNGPSYAIHPPIEKYFHGKALLNYVGAELTVCIPQSHGWDLALRLYHRSGAWGLYSPDADEGTMLGIGIRKRF
jgi:hypothetical protein